MSLSIEEADMDRIVHLTAIGGVENLETVHVPPEPPAPGMVRVRNHAIGVNFIDIYHRIGLYPLALPAPLVSRVRASSRRLVIA